MTSTIRRDLSASKYDSTAQLQQGEIYKRAKWGNAPQNPHSDSRYNPELYHLSRLEEEARIQGSPMESQAHSSTKWELSRYRKR